jgi:hypothetical protein
VKCGAYFSGARLAVGHLMEIQWKFSGNSVEINRQITTEFQPNDSEAHDYDK